MFTLTDIIQHKITYKARYKQQWHKACSDTTIFVMRIHSRTLVHCCRTRVPRVHYKKWGTRIAVSSPCQVHRRNRNYKWHFCKHLKTKNNIFLGKCNHQIERFRNAQFRWLRFVGGIAINVALCPVSRHMWINSYLRYKLLVEMLWRSFFDTSLGWELRNWYKFCHCYHTQGRCGHQPQDRHTQRGRYDVEYSNYYIDISSTGSFVSLGKRKGCVKHVHWNLPKLRLALACDWLTVKWIVHEVKKSAKRCPD
jgi:hypothetical protein